jgi:hypothetical protein
LGVLHPSGGANAVAGCWPTPEEHIPSGLHRVRVGLFPPAICGSWECQPATHLGLDIGLFRFAGSSLAHVADVTDKRSLGVCNSDEEEGPRPFLTHSWPSPRASQTLDFPSPRRATAPFF